MEPGAMEPGPPGAVSVSGLRHVYGRVAALDGVTLELPAGRMTGIIGPDGSLVIGLREQNDSGFTGIAFLSPGADGASTDVSLFLAEAEG